MNLFTLIIAFIIGLAAGYVAGSNYPWSDASNISAAAKIAPENPPRPEPEEQPGHAYWCGQIAGEVLAQKEIFETEPTPELPECKHPRELSQEYENAPSPPVAHTPRDPRLALVYAAGALLAAGVLTAFGSKRLARTP
jgi:hypothetical protein